MNIYLLRHGQTDWNLESRFQGRMDIPMNENGMAQIRKSTDVLASMISDVDVILSSPLTRARQSAEIAADRLSYPKENIVTDPMFIERAFGEAEGQVTTAMWDEAVISQYAGAELRDEVCDRAEKALQRVAETYAGKNVLIAAHGAILKAVIAAVLGREYVYEVRKMKLESGCVYLLKLENGVWEAFKCDMEEAVFEEVQ